MTSEPPWAIIASLFVGNVILLLLNVPLVGLWISIQRVAPMWWSDREREVVVAGAG